jgi:hypothetical protein
MTFGLGIGRSSCARNRREPVAIEKLEKQHIHLQTL